MARVRVSIPATINSFGPGLNATALAIRLYQTIELAEVETGFGVEVQPGRSDASAERLRSAVLRAVRAVCREAGRTPAGLRAVVDHGSLAGRGLGLSAGLPLGCAVAINALFGGPLGREAILALVLGSGCRPAPVVASLVGSLSIAANNHPAALHTVVSAASQEIIVVAPDAEETESPKLQGSGRPDSGALNALLVEALRSGDFGLLGELSAHVMAGRTVRGEWIAARRAALQAGAAAVFIHEHEHSAAVFARSRHDQIVEALAEAWPGAAIWRTEIETRGISIDALDVSAGAAEAPIPAGKPHS